MKNMTMTALSTLILVSVCMLGAYAYAHEEESGKQVQLATEILAAKQASNFLEVEAKNNMKLHVEEMPHRHEEDEDLLAGHTDEEDDN